MVVYTRAVDKNLSLDADPKCSNLQKEVFYKSSIGKTIIEEYIVCYQFFCALETLQPGALFLAAKFSSAVREYLPSNQLLLT